MVGEKRTAPAGKSTPAKTGGFFRDGRNYDDMRGGGIKTAGNWPDEVSPGGAEKENVGWIFS